MADPQLLVYGVTGYTGRLTVPRAAALGMAPVLAGRDAAAVAELAAPHGWEHRAFALDDPEAVRRGLDRIAVVLHLAGPFSRTSRPMADACLATGTHYLDITGEIAVMEALAALDKQARAAGVMLLPGTGFDVVPSDCLAAHVAARLPDATALRLGLAGMVDGPGRPSQGTARSAVEGLGSGAYARKGGRLVKVPAGRERTFDYGRGPEASMLVPWGDVASAWHSTGVPDIEVYFRAPALLRRANALSRWVRPLLASPPAQWALNRLVDRQPAGPDDRERAAATHVLVAEAHAADGIVVTSRLRTPNGYTLTVETSLAIAREVLDGRAEPGFRTPAMLLGPDYVLGFDGVTREDLD